MKIRIIRPYKDILLNRYTKINEILEVTPQRYKELQERIPTFIEIVEMPTEVITTIVEQRVDNIIVETDNKKVVIENKEEIKPKKKRKK